MAKIPPNLVEQQPRIRTSRAGFADFDDRIDQLGQFVGSLVFRKVVDPRELSGQLAPVVDEIDNRGLAPAGPRTSAFNTLKEAAHGRFTQLALAGCLKSLADAGFDVVNGLTAFPDNPRGLEQDLIRLKGDAPALLEQVGDEEANGSKLEAVAIVDIVAGQLAKLFGKGGRRRSDKIDRIPERPSFVGRKEGREGTLPARPV
jgi:hypothetical protein